jgi:flagellar hook-associated protein 1
MLSLFGALDMGSRALQTQQQGVEVAGQNLANATNPAYARQRLVIGTATPLNTFVGQQGTGANVTGIQQIRSAILDSQITSEASVTGSLQAQQNALQYAEANLGQQIDGSSNTGGVAAASGNQSGLADGLSSLFNAFQSLTTDPSSLGERQALLSAATQLSGQFNDLDQKLGTLQGQLNDSLSADTKSANGLLNQIADLNGQIAKAEQQTGAPPNDLLDSRQQALESLAQIVKVDASPGDNDTLNIAIGGVSFVSGGQAVDSLQVYDSGGGNMQLRASSAGTALIVTGGSLHGTIDARDGAVATLRNGVNTLAAQLIQQVNAAHAGGYGLNGTTGADFFTGTGAGDIKVNSALIDNPGLVQAAGAAGATGDGQNALALAQLANQPVTALGGATFGQNYAQTVAGFGQSLASVNQQVTDQTAVAGMLQQQRASVSGVSTDEEMTNLIKFQQAYAASAKLVSTLDNMLGDLMAMKAS